MALNFKDNKSVPLKKVLPVLLLVVCLVCATVYSREGEDGVLHGIQAGFQSISSPFKFVGAGIGAAGESVEEGIDNVSADDATLTQLREQNAELRELVAQTEEYRLEAERLEELLGIKDRYGIEGVTGRVIGRSTDAWNQTVTLDVGTNDGVESGLTVMGASGVVGQVVSASPGSCTVRLLTDPQSGAAALIQSSRAEGIVRGSLDGLLYLQNIDADVQVSVGDVVLTSGLGGSYTRGLMIGTVVRVDGSTGDASRRIVVSPNDTTGSLEELIVVFSADASSLVTADESEDAEGSGDE